MMHIVWSWIKLIGIDVLSWLHVSKIVWMHVIKIKWTELINIKQLSWFNHQWPEITLTGFLPCYCLLGSCLQDLCHVIVPLWSCWQDLQHKEWEEEEMLQWVSGLGRHAHPCRAGPVWSIPGYDLLQQEHLPVWLLQRGAHSVHVWPLRGCHGGEVHEWPQTSHLCIRWWVSWPLTVVGRYNKVWLQCLSVFSFTSAKYECDL